MRPPSQPQINRDNPDKYYIFWNQDVPQPLWNKYPRKRIRIKKYEDINRYRGEQREEYAELKRKEWEYKIFILKYSPFDEKMLDLLEVKDQKLDLKKKITIKVQNKELEAKRKLPEEAKRKLFMPADAFKAFIKSRVDRKLASQSISSYEGTIDWINEAFKELGHDAVPIGDIRHTHLSESLNYIAKDRKWVATTINKEIDFLMSVFNWLEIEDYVMKNPSKGKMHKLPVNKSKHRWYDRDIKTKVIEAIILEKNTPLLRACQFTYWLMIRSKKELRMLQVGDIDRTLKRIRFSAELSKTKREEYRDYPPEFEAILNEMHLERYPLNFYVFGEKNGEPSLKQCGHNYFSKMFMAVKKRLGLSMDYTVYGFKHTRIVHELMKGTDGYHISYMARHNDRKSTKDYQRDYDITLVNVYGPEDLKF